MTLLDMSIFQTVGLCFNFCVGNYAFAVLNYQSCWCSNWAPAESTDVDVSECNIPCPGYPFEFCGGDNNLFGYVALGMNPSGTSTPAGASSTKVGWLLFHFICLGGGVFSIIIVCLFFYFFSFLSSLAMIFVARMT